MTTKKYLKARKLRYKTDKAYRERQREIARESYRRRYADPKKRKKIKENNKRYYLANREKILKKNRIRAKKWNAEHKKNGKKV